MRWRRGSNERRSSPLRRDPSPVITEKATASSEHNQVVFRVRKDATKPQIKAAVEKLFEVKVTGVNTLVRKGKTKRFRGTVGHAERRQARDRDSGRRPVDRRDDGPLRQAGRERTMALRTYKPVTPGLRQLVLVDRSALYKGAPVKTPDRGPEQVGRPQQQRAHHVRSASRAATSAPIAWSTSSAASSTCRRRSSGSNMIRTARPSSR